MEDEALVMAACEAHLEKKPASLRQALEHVEGCMWCSEYIFLLKHPLPKSQPGDVRPGW